MFTTPCFIRKNTPELRKKLEKLGYEPSRVMLVDDYLCIATAVTEDYAKYTVIDEGMFDSSNPHITWNCAGRIDCGNNESLFLAIAALRDDSDKNQLFVTEEEMHWVNQDAWMPVGSFIFSYIDNYTNIDGKVHKATVEELIDHFGSEG